MDQAFLIGLVLFVALVILGRTMVVRRSGADEVDLNWIVFGSALLAGIFTIWAGLRTVAANLPMGLFILAIGGVTIILLARIVAAGRAVKRPPVGELTGPSFDYLVWVGLGLPMLIVVALAILAITGGLTPRGLTPH
jgi:predicted benzoate:H+ symporter BenE